MNTTLVSFSSRIRDSVLVVDLAGTIDAYNIREFQSEARACVWPGVKKVVLDCWAVNYISSVGIGAIVSLHREISRWGGSLIVAGLKKSLYEVFSVLGITSVLALADTEDEAVERLNNPGPVFPVVVGCVICGRKLRATKSGAFRCPCCRAIIAVDPNAQVRLR